MADTKLSKSRLEALIAMASGMVAQPASGLAGLYGLATGDYNKAADNVAATQQALTYAPRDPRGLQEIAQAVAPVTRRLDALKHFLGDKTLGHTKSPGLATAAYMVPDTLLTLLGARGMGVKGPKLAQIAERSAADAGMGSPMAQRGAIGWHGTDADFSEFDPAYIGKNDAGFLGRGFYTSTDPEVARGAANQLEVDVDLRNPLRIEMPDWRTDKRALVRRALGLDGSASAEQVTAAARAAGHDGVVLDYSPAGYKHKEMLAFDAKQMRIKGRGRQQP